MSVHSNNSKTMQPNFTNFLHMLPVAPSSSDGISIYYVLPVVLMTSCFYTIGPIGGQMDTTLCTSLPAATGRVQATAGRPTHNTHNMATATAAATLHRSGHFSDLVS